MMKGKKKRKREWEEGSRVEGKKRKEEREKRKDKREQRIENREKEVRTSFFLTFVVCSFFFSVFLFSSLLFSPLLFSDWSCWVCVLPQCTREV